MLCCADRHRRSRVVKPSRSRDKPVGPTKTQEHDVEQVTGAASEAPLTPEERARLLAELEAELEAAERSIEEEGTISAEEFLELRAAYWTGLVQNSGEEIGKAPRRRRR
jgi:acyl-CoA reductase-like NAD-dependent aldehyde dehydrogenase